MQLTFIVGITTLSITVVVYFWLIRLEQVKQSTIVAGKSFVSGTTRIVVPSKQSVEASSADQHSPQETISPLSELNDHISAQGAVSSTPAVLEDLPLPQANVPLSPTGFTAHVDNPDIPGGLGDIPVWLRKKHITRALAAAQRGDVYSISPSDFPLDDVRLDDVPSGSFAAWGSHLGKQVNKDAEKIVLHTHELDVSLGQTCYLIKRRVRITYNRQTQIGKACYINIHIAGDLNDLSTVAKRQHSTLHIAPSHSLQFYAQEQMPLLQAELQFAAGEFSSSQTVMQQTLRMNNETEFQFIVKPLKAEDCLLTVSISYIHKDDLRENEAPLADEILTTNIAITAQSFFGLQEGQLALFKRAVSMVGVALLLFLAFRDGQLVTNYVPQQLDVSRVAQYLALIAANMGIVPLLDALRKHWL